VVRFCVDCLGPLWTGSLVENIAFVGPACLVAVIMTLMCVLCVVESLCQAVMGRLSTLKYMLPDARGSHWLHPVFSDI
jgi:hypothetical protein